MRKRKLLRLATTLAFYGILARDEVQAGNFKTSQQKDKILKYLERTNRLAEKIASFLMEDKR